MTLQHRGFDPVVALSALLRAAGLVAVIMALIMVCTAKLDNLAANHDSWRQGFVSAEDRTRQLECLANNIYWEAASEPFEGKVAVAQVTLNRAASGQFPGDVCRVVYQKNLMYEKVICQFSWACDRDTGMRPTNKANYDESMSVAKKVLLEGFKLPSLENAMYFHGDYINPGWNRKKVAHIGRHIFYE